MKQFKLNVLRVATSRFYFWSMGGRPRAARSSHAWILIPPVLHCCTHNLLRNGVPSCTSPHVHPRPDRVCASPVLHVQLATSRRDATLAVIRHLHRSSRRNNGTITSRLLHCQYLGHPPRRKMPFRRRRRRWRRRRPLVNLRRAARHDTARLARDEVRHNLSSADAVDASSSLPLQLL